MNGYDLFTHRVDITGSSREQIVRLFKLRRWLWNFFGPSCEYRELSKLEIQYPTEDFQWAWDTEHGHTRVYLRRHALTQFLLMKTKLETIDENI